MIDPEHETDMTDYATCPFCGGEYVDDLQASGTINCDCGNSFRYEADYDVTYSTTCVEHDYGEPQPWHRPDGSTGRCSFCKRCGEVNLELTEGQDAQTTEN